MHQTRQTTWINENESIKFLIEMVFIARDHAKEDMTLQNSLAKEQPFLWMNVEWDNNLLGGERERILLGNTIKKKKKNVMKRLLVWDYNNAVSLSYSRYEQEVFSLFAQLLLLYEMQAHNKSISSDCRIPIYLSLALLLSIFAKDGVQFNLLNQQ